MFDLTGLVQQWVGGGLPNYGVLIKGVGKVSTEYVFRSSEQPYAPNEQYVPVLEVSYWLESEMPLP
jgi:hypothetical protein